MDQNTVNLEGRKLEVFGKRKGRGPFRILIGTRSPLVLPALERMSEKWEVREAISTDVAYRLLGGCHLAVVEPSDLLERQLSREGLARTLTESRIPWTSAAATRGNGSHSNSITADTAVCADHA